MTAHKSLNPNTLRGGNDIAPRVGQIMGCLYGLPLADATSLLIVALAEVVDQAPDHATMWEAVLKAIEAERREPAQ